MDERRRAPRLRALKHAQIVFNDGHSAIDCTVRNISAKGAGLMVSPLGVPDQFVLSIPSDNVRHACRVIWRRPDRVGVSFDI